jgi:hypothetical protein
MDVEPGAIAATVLGHRRVDRHQVASGELLHRDMAEPGADKAAQEFGVTIPGAIADAIANAVEPTFDEGADREDGRIDVGAGTDRGDNRRCRGLGLVFPSRSRT